MLRVIIFLPIMVVFDLILLAKFTAAAFMMPFSDDEYAKEEIREQWKDWKSDLRKHYIGF